MRARGRRERRLLDREPGPVRVGERALEQAADSASKPPILAKRPVSASASGGGHGREAETSRATCSLRQRMISACVLPQGSIHE
jgi:hypothetical protein